MLAATAAGGVVTAATMTTANATPEVAPVKSDIAFGNPNDSRRAPSTPSTQGASAIPVRKIRPSGTSFQRFLLRRRQRSATCR